MIFLTRGNGQDTAGTPVCRRGHITLKVLRRMKLTILLLTTVLLQVSANGISQNVSLRVKDAPLEQVFKLIEQQTGYGFLYTTKTMRGAEKVSIDLKNVPLKQALQQLLRNQGMSFSMPAGSNTIVIRKQGKVIDPVSVPSVQPTTIAPTVQQLAEIKGIVKSDDSGEPLVGATITVKGTKTVTLTDARGEFSINASPGTVLVITYVGYVAQEITIKKSDYYEVKLATSPTSVNETVVTGVYVRPKSNFTGASSSFTSEDIARVSNSNVLNALQSLDPSFQLMENLNLGSNPNVLPDVVLRSGNSLVDLGGSSTVPFDYANGANTPLFILDGFEVPLQRINDLDINRIAKVDILKDAAATSIYGSRAANGVIVIETIRPKEGKLRFTYMGNISVEAPDLSSYNLLNAREKFDLENVVNAYSFSGWNFREEDLGFFYNQRLAAIERGVNTDWISQPVQTGIGTKHAIYVEGGANDALYGVNLAYNRITGAMKGSDRQTLTGNTFLSYRVKKFQFRNDLTINVNKANNSPYGSFLKYTRLNPYWTPYDSVGNMKVYLEDVRNLGGARLTNFDFYDNLHWYDYPSLFVNPAEPRIGRPTNPLYNAGLNIVDQTSYNNIVNNFSTQWQAAQWLKFTGRFAYQYQADESDEFLPAQHTAFVNKPTFEKGSYTKGYGKRQSMEGMVTADMNKLIGLHQFFATVGANIQQTKYNTESFRVEGFPNPRLDQLVLGNRFPQDTKPTGTESIVRLFGLLSNVSYSYANKYLLDFSFRSDGSSQFGALRRFAPFWSAGAGWNIHNEEAIRELGFVDRLKLRYSFGYTGSQNFASYQAISTSQYYTSSDYRGVIGTYLLGFGNDALAWQKTQKSNFGADITLFKKLDITGNYFIEKTQGSIATISTAPSTGFISYAENMGDVIGRGWELYLRYNILNNNAKRNNLSVFANLFSVRNKIEKVSSTIAAMNARADTAKSSRPITRYAEGQSTSAIWAVPSKGIDPASGYEIFVKRDGSLSNIYDPRDQVIIGDSRPKLEGTFGTNLELNGIGFNVFFRFRYGGQAYNQTLVERVENVTVAYYNVDRRVYEDRWQQPGDITFFKGLVDYAGFTINAPTYTTSRFVQNDNLLALENLTMYYRFSNSLNKKLGLENTRISFFTSNVFRVSSIRRERGLDYPFAKTFSLQIQTSF